ncbi:MAG: cation-transporting P-type ATPase [Candidatus Helarchaeota archaeon]|nr:cation-transporting P-type ATPase [Candidatus Helarchaeota archaeon]
MLFLGEIGSAAISFGIIIINAITAIVQQFRAQKTIESLKKIRALTSNTIRQGKEQEISAIELIPGDILVLKQGDKVPADARIIETVDLTVDESILTGESLPVEKNNQIISIEDDDLENGVPLQDQTNMLFMGTYLTTGRSKSIVTGTGVNTEIGKISKNLAQVEMADIPLTKKMNRFAKFLALVVIILLVVVFVYSLLTAPAINIHTIRDKFKFALSIGMNIVPINLPLLTTIILITGVLNLAKGGVIIRNLSAVESLGRVSVILSDKTGTITQNQMTVKKLWYNDNIYDVEGSGYDKEGRILLKGKEINISTEPCLELLFLSIVINNNSSIQEEEIKVKVKGQDVKVVRRSLGAPTETALLVLAEKAALDPFIMKDRFQFVQELPFDSTVKRMATVIENEKGEYMAFVKGASEIILNRSNKIVLNDKEIILTETKLTELSDLIKKYANEGFRTLSIAFKRISEKKDKYEREEVENDLTFHGFVAILDPPREGVKEAVDSCESAGIRVVMITGDHPNTAKSIASQMDIFEAGEIVVEGKDIKNMTKDDLSKAAVFARVSPSDKEIIVRRLQDEENRVVAMTGDGINDSLALKLSNTGIAMGIAGTDVAKESADMVISDDNFTSIEKGIRVGRGLFSKIRTLIYYFICMDLVEGIFFFSLAFIPNFEFYTFIQHMFLVLAVHSLPPLALTFDSHPKEVMKEPPRDTEEIFSPSVLKLLIFHVLFILIGVIAGFLLSSTPILGPNAENLNPFISFIDIFRNTFAWHQKAATICMTILFISEPIMVWNIRRPNSPVNKSIKEEFNILILIMVSLTIVAQVLLVVLSGSVIPRLQAMGIDFNQMYLSLTDWIWVILLSIQSFIAVEIYKWRARKKNIFF